MSVEVYVIRVPKSVGKVLLAVSRLADRSPDAKGPARRPAESESYESMNGEEDSQTGS